MTVVRTLDGPPRCAAVSDENRLDEARFDQVAQKVCTLAERLDDEQVLALADALHDLLRDRRRLRARVSERLARRLGAGEAPPS